MFSHNAIAAPFSHMDNSRCRSLIDAKRYSDAFQVCKKGAQDGDPVSQFNLSFIYSRGLGVVKDTAKAVIWLKSSASKRYPPAEYALSSRYASGKGVDRNLEQATALLTDAANQGFLLAQYMLGRMNEAGYQHLGIKKNVKVAIDWYKRLAGKCAVCQYELFRIYYFGIGVHKDVPMAVRYLSTAADAGLPKAQMQLGFSYYSGEGVPKDYVLAYQWFYVASKAGEMRSKKAMDLLAKKMTVSQLAKAKSRSHMWMESQKINTSQLCAIYGVFCAR